MSYNNNPKYLLVDTKYRLYGSTTNFRYQLPIPIDIKEYIKISYLYMARTNYLINSTNNTFDIIINNQITNIILPEQNFTPLTLSVYISNYMNNISNFKCVYNEFTYKFEFNCDTEFKIDFSKSEFNKLISMNNSVYTSIFKKIISGIVNFNNPHYLNINITNISNNIMMGNNSYN
jgi:hypothetical protein